MSCRKIAELPLAYYHPQVGAIWRSRDDEPEQQVFESLPEWMDSDPDRTQDRRDICRLITEALETLTPKEEKVLQLRYLQDCTLEEVGKLFEVTKERIRQIEHKALRKMRHPSRFDYLRQYHDLFWDSRVRAKRSSLAARPWAQKYLPVEEGCNVDPLIEEEMLLQKYLRYRLNRLNEGVRETT